MKTQIRNILREEVKPKILNEAFDKVFDKLKVNDSGEMYFKWIDSDNNEIFHRNHWGMLWVIDCDTYNNLRFYSQLFSMDIDEFNDYLIQYVNNRYKELFGDNLIKSVGDEHGCNDVD